MTKEIAEIYGVQSPAVNRAAVRFGLGRRAPAQRRARTGCDGAGAAFDCAVDDREEAAPELVVPVCPGGAHWSPDRDREIVVAGGRYAAIGALAAQWGVASRLILARWHVLRAAGGGIK